MTDTIDHDAALESYLDATHDARMESYKAFLRIPSISGIPAHAPDCRAAAEWLADAMTDGRARARRGLGDHRPSGRVRGLAACRGRPDGHRVRALRRPAGRSARAVDLAAVRAGDRRRPDARAWRGRRQGPGPPARHGGRRRARDARRLPGQPEVHLRGRGGVRRRSTSMAGSRPTAIASQADVAIISDSGFFEGNIPAITVGLRGIMYAQIDVVGTAVDLHSGGVRRRRPEPGQRPGPDHRRAQGPGRPDPDPRVLRRRRAH